MYEDNVHYKDGGVKSIRLEKDKVGKASGYWKGITSTEAQEFTYSVGKCGYPADDPVSTCAKY